MAITSQLGTPDSYLGNIVLGQTGVSGGSSGYDLNINQTLTLSQTAAGGVIKIHVVNINNTITFFQSFVKNIIRTRDIDDTLVIIEEAKIRIPMTINANVSQSLTLAHTLTKNFLANRNINNTIVLVQSTLRGYTPHPLIAEIIPVSEFIAATKVKERNISETITLAPTLATQKWILPVINEKLTINQTSVSSTQFGRGISEVIPIHGGMIKTLRNIDFTINEVELTKPPRKCVITLEFENFIIALPCPEFNDSEKNLHSLTIKRSMTNVVYTYIRRNELQALTYSFVLGIGLAQDFQDFIEQSNNSDNPVIVLKNWKGELWKGYITTNPVEFTPKARFENEGERVETTIEFQGIRLV